MIQARRSSTTISKDLLEMRAAMPFQILFRFEMGFGAANSTRKSEMVSLGHVLAMLKYQMHDGNLDVSMKNYSTLVAGEAHNVLGHGYHFFAKQVNVALGLSELVRVVATHVVNNFEGLGKPGSVATIQLTLKGHVSVHLFQMAFGVLNVLVTKVAAISVLDLLKMPVGLEVLLGPFTVFIPLSAFVAVSRGRYVGDSEKRFIGWTRWTWR